MLAIGIGMRATLDLDRLEGFLCYFLFDILATFQPRSHTPYAHSHSYSHTHTYPVERAWTIHCVKTLRTNNMIIPHLLIPFESQSYNVNAVTELVATVDLTSLTQYNSRLLHVGNDCKSLNQGTEWEITCPAFVCRFVLGLLFPA